MAIIFQQLNGKIKQIYKTYIKSLNSNKRLLWLGSTTARFALAGSLQITMYEKSCAIGAQCGLSGQKYASGLYFNYTNICCDTDLCNGAETFAAPSWSRLVLIVLPALALLLLAWASSRGILTGSWERKRARHKKKIFCFEFSATKQLVKVEK